MSKGHRQSGRRQPAPKPKKDYRTERYIQYIFDGRESGPVHWMPVLRAALYDHNGCPRDAAPFWRKVQRESVGKPYNWVPREAQDILGELLPPSSYLFDLLEKAQEG